MRVSCTAAVMCNATQTRRTMRTIHRSRPGRKYRFAHGAEEHRVGVDGIGTKKDLEVAEHVGDHEPHQHRDR